MRSRAQAKVEQLGLEPMAPEAIREVVQQAQPPQSELGETEPGSGARVPWPLLSVQALQRQPNGVWLLQDQHGFRLDLSQLAHQGELLWPLVIRRCRNFCIEASAGEIVIPENWDTKRLLLLDQCAGFQLGHLHLRGSRNPITLNRCRRFLIDQISIKRARGYALTLLRCQAGTVRNSSFLAGLASGINLVGQCRDLHIQHCRIMSSTGPYNWDAGINCMHCSPAIILRDLPEASHEALDLRDKRDTPHCIWIESCEISQCRAQGIYLEGAAQILIENCLIKDNNKEGICFDWGTSFCHLRYSQVLRNGERADYDEATCAIDFLPPQFCDSKGRHFCQLPGISIDNGYANTIEHNLIAANYGGGIKVVRSGFNNLIRFNQVGGNGNRISLDANDEFSDNPYQPSEIKLLNMGPGAQQEFDPERAHLDFLPPAGNCIHGNLIHAYPGNLRSALSAWDFSRATQDNQITL